MAEEEDVGAEKKGRTQVRAKARAIATTNRGETAARTGADAAAGEDDLLQTPGLDGIMVGPADLAVTMGHLDDFNHPDIRARIADVRTACQRHSVPFGIFAATEPAARLWAAEGARFMTIGADTQFLDQGIAKSRSLASSLRQSR